MPAAAGPPPVIEKLDLPAGNLEIRELAGLLCDAVDAGASVSFLAPFDLARAEAYWMETFAKAAARSTFLVARDESGIAGSVQLHPSWAPNQPHRGEIAKLLVHRRARRRGIATALMQEIEVHARALGFTLLTLDTKLGDAAEQLYERAGWTRVGVIPGYALNPDGSPADTVIFYKLLGGV
jgi:ribosomal protein S18 acetylase RimI-like enzyme